MSLLVVIPAYEAASTVGEVVAGARQSGHPVVVVDDGSEDGTGRAAEEAGAVVLRHATNQGKGAALQTAFAWAERQGVEAVLTLDADLQHDPAEIPALARAHEAAPSALVIGVRRFEGMPRRSLAGNRISTWWISRFTGHAYRDTQSGFRVYPRALYAGRRLRTCRFDTETELLLLAAHARLPLVEVPIRTIYFPPGDPLRGHRTHFRDVSDTLRIVRLIAGSPLWSRERIRGGAAEDSSASPAPPDGARPR